MLRPMLLVKLGYYWPFLAGLAKAYRVSAFTQLGIFSYHIDRYIDLCPDCCDPDFLNDASCRNRYGPVANIY